MRLKDPQTGRFIKTENPKGERISTRVSPNVYLDIIDASNGRLAEFVREAIAEKLERERHQKETA